MTTRNKVQAGSKRSAPSSFRKQAVHGLKKGDRFYLKRRFTREKTLLFGDLTKDYNPVHYDQKWGKMKGFDGLICHGLLVGSMICEFGGQVGWLASGMSFKFIKPVFFDDEITCHVILTDVQENGRAKAEARFLNQHGQQVAFAELSGRLPVEKEQQYLKQMVRSGDPTNKISGKEQS